MLLRFICIISSTFCYNFILPICISSKIGNVPCPCFIGSLSFYYKFIEAYFLKSHWIIWKLILLFLKLFECLFSSTGLLGSKMAIDAPILSLCCHPWRDFLPSTSALTAEEHILACCSYCPGRTEGLWKRKVEDWAPASTLILGVRLGGEWSPSCRVT